MEHKIWNSVRLIIYRPFHQPISQIQDGTQDLILFSLTNLSVVIDDLFQVKSLQSNDFVKIQRGVHPPPNLTQGGKCTANSPPLKTTYEDAALLYSFIWRHRLFWFLEEGGGVQKSSICNHNHPNVFCGMLAPQFVITTTSICNQEKNVNFRLLVSYN